MDNRRYWIAAGVFLFILIAVFAFSQQWTEKAKVSVPFEFVVGNTFLPAGNYLVSTPDGNNRLLRFKNTDSGAEVYATNIDVSAKSMYNENSNLVFLLDSSGRHVLHQIWINDQSHGHDLLHEKGLPETR
jgi:hypothetical protein